MLTSIMAKLFAEKYPTKKIFANYTLNLPNFSLTPYGFIPMSLFNDCLIILDDIASIMTTLKGFSKLIVNASRKANVTIYMTGQYYTQLERYIRNLSITLLPRFDKNKNRLTIFESLFPLAERIELNNPMNYKRYVFNNPIGMIDGLYDTKEIVRLVDSQSMLEEIIKMSPTTQDLRENVALWKDSDSAQQSVFKKLKKMGYEV